MSCSLKGLRKLFFAVLILFVAGCSITSTYMSAAHKFQEPSKENATITFFRYYQIGKYSPAPVAEVVDGKKLKPVGVVMNSYKVTQEVKPGSHTFVVVGEETSIVNCTVEANKHYYVRVRPYMGTQSTRFVFDPITRDELTSKEKVRNELFSCTAMELNSSGASWFNSEEDTMREKLTNPAKKATLDPQDGIDELL